MPEKFYQEILRFTEEISIRMQQIILLKDIIYWVPFFRGRLMEKTEILSLVSTKIF